MGVDKIVQLVGVIVAVVAAFVAIPYGAAIVALLGIAGGWFIAAEDRQRLLIAAIALLAVAGGLDAIPAVGGYITTALNGLSGLLNAGAATAIVLGIIDRLKP
ncbi:MAG: hypothetical protein OEM25_04760 [Gammaproteobacteria bacterium]|nr:hypothetical protein [Gammaproteobacteria bacterium]